MHTFTSTMLLFSIAASTCHSIPLYTRQSKDLNRNNEIAPNFGSASVIDNGNGSFSVLGLKPTTKELAIEIACINDFSKCKRDSNDDSCAEFSTACEINNNIAGLSVPANSGGGFDSLDAATQESFRKEAPPRIGAPKDIDLGGTDGFTIRDNGDGTFNVGDLIVNGLTLASEIGCLVKEKNCAAAANGRDCAQEKVACEEENALSGVPVRLNKTPA